MSDPPRSFLKTERVGLPIYREEMKNKTKYVAGASGTCRCKQHYKVNSSDTANLYNTPNALICWTGL